MYITKVSYRKTFNLGNYENETIEMTSDVDINESPDDVLEKIKIRVHRCSANYLAEPEMARTFFEQ